MDRRRRPEPSKGQRTTERRSTRELQASGRLHLLVIGENLYATHPLPEAGAVVIGRSPACEIFIDHPSVSRRHAVVDVGPPLAIADAGSANGTRVRNVRLEPDQRVELAPGDLIELGALQLVVQQRSVLAVRRRRVWNHDYFDARLEEECDRCEMTGARFSVIHLRANPTKGPEIVDVLVEQLRTFDIVGSYAPGQYEVLLCDASPEQAADAERRLVGALAARNLDATVGVAHYPGDGRATDAIIARAAERARAEPHRTRRVELAETVPTLRHLIERIAQANVNVLVQGETGVGKNVIAETIHRISPRAEQPFVRLHCAAVSASSIDSELFGHTERGKPGVLEAAHKGTVFLDAITELPAATQVKLLRAIEERRVSRIGSSVSKPIDIRLIAATNGDLLADVARGLFLPDLYAQINGITLTIPALRERQTEIAPLVELFVGRASADGGRSAPSLAPASMSLLHRYPWPGNIRELEHVMERAVLLCQGDVIEPEHLPADKMHATRTVARPAATAASRSAAQRSGTTERRRDGRAQRRMEAPTPPNEVSLDFQKEKRQRERQQIILALEASEGNQSKAAAMLGISRRTLSTKLDVYRLPRPRKRL